MNGEAPSTERLWELLSARLRGFIRSRVADEQTASDLLQETFLRIHARLDDIREQERVASWVFQIARHLIADHHRAGRRENGLPGEPRAENADEENLNELVAGWVPAMIEQLPEAYREAVTLYEIEGLPQQEIATRLGLSLSGAKSRVQRGRVLLKRLFHDCCTFDMDRRGNILDYSKKKRGCPACTEGTDRPS